MRSENYIIQLELEIQRLREENEMLRIKLLNNQNSDQSFKGISQESNNEFKIGDTLTPFKDCMGNFKKGYDYLITDKYGNDFVIDDVALINKTNVYQNFKKVVAND